MEIKTKPATLEFMNDSRRLIRFIITEGKNRQIRYTFMNLGYKVKRLERTGYGTLTLKNISKGSYRLLRKNEIQALRKLAGFEKKED